MQKIWEAQLDDIFDCTVIRTGERTGQLTVKENVNGNILLDKEVGLSYGALFGPDIDDVTLWQELCIEVVDKQ